MGVLRSSITVGASRAIALALLGIAGIILSRKLPTEEYAIYQLATKRIYVYFSFLIAIIGYWVYRYIAQGRRGAFKTYLVIVLISYLITFCAGTILIHMLGANIITSTILGLCASLILLNHSLNHVLIGIYPEQIGFSMFVRSIIYAGSLIYFAYTTGLHLSNVGIACDISLLTSLLIILASTIDLAREPFCKQCVKEWIKGSWLPAIGWIATFIAGLDAIIVASIASVKVVAIFFALTLIPRMMLDVVGWSLGHIHAYILKTRDFSSSIVTSRIVFIIAMFLAGYSIAVPWQIAAFSGREYIPYAVALTALVPGLLAMMYNDAVSKIMSGLDTSTADRPGILLVKNAKGSLYSSILYALMLAIMLYIVGANTLIAVINWGIALLVSNITALIYKLMALNREDRSAIVRGLMLPSLIYLLFAYVFSTIFATRSYSPIFIKNLLITATGIAKALAVYIIFIILIDNSARLALRRIVESVRR